MKIIKLLLNPVKIYWKIKWLLAKRKLKHCGSNVKFGKRFSINGYNRISIANNCSFGDECSLDTWEYYNGEHTNFKPDLVIGSNVSICKNSYISCLNKVQVGDGCLFGPNTFITDNFHGANKIEEMDSIPIKRKLFSKGPVIIGKNVWLGRNVCVMPNVTIGDYAVIGANSVVTHDIPPYAIAAGSPAKVVKMIQQ